MYVDASQLRSVKHFFRKYLPVGRDYYEIRLKFPDLCQRFLIGPEFHRLHHGNAMADRCLLDGSGLHLLSPVALRVRSGYDQLHIVI